MSESASGPLGFLRKENIVAPEGYNRWRVPPASIAIHLCIGSVYAWSVFNPPLTRELGIVASSGADWSLSSVVWIFSVAIVALGLAAAFGGKWLEKVGPRYVGVVAATLWGGGFIIGSLGISSHQLWLVYLGYGVFGGAGLGLGYVSPVSTLIRWFPDRRGMATGMAIMGFGGGAMIGAPLIGWLLSNFQKAPEYLGAESTLNLITEGGRRFAETASGKVEIVLATAQQAAAFGGEAGAYGVGTGNTGAAATFMALGIGYFIVMIIAAFQYRVPKEGWKPEGWQPAPSASGMVTRNNVHIDQALKTRQFWLLWIVLCFNVTAGIGVIGVAKTMINEIFGELVVVTAAFAGTYVLMISVFNMVGRFFWASTSDFIGRKNTYHCFFILGTILYLSIPFWAGMGGGAALIGFYIATMIIFTMYGGGFATIPAYLADMFGTMHVGGIHGRLLTAWSTAGVLGPFAITYLRDLSRNNAISDLVARMDPAAFAERFGAPVSSLQELVDANTVTIARLMEIAPAGTADPTPSLYNTTMYAMAALLVIAFFANLFVRPVGDRHHVEKTHPRAVAAE
ncbi:OFA family MFS transporter [Pseudohalocynthiibacter aestuariivivens]|jgi:MFS family permease|uniref:OFA family MFS transporter n=1 Tax=Pseudohalocynthiibacter aestuariivivens TaxID=1591409 RepID=A0ABV5JCT3_9RHOB|nr:MULTISPECIES: OFA family MFS transporter [Pseudohalocynthiibacter]MBS9718602.1 OFA family MFS transporter [Pseudohalocynthiibacter aestuariivivens]MCK0103613.1 OFA family MFS transporter [Pseudohalocynthiibacter sp. F2068]